MFSDKYQKPKKKLTPKEAKIKAGDYCAYQERSQQEVRNKLFEYGLFSNDVEQVISELISENFINEERFAKAYAGGKFRIKNWGRIKIIQGLKRHKISDYCIKKGLSEIDENEYFDLLEKLLANKMALIQDTNLQIRNKKIVSYLMQKGFESNLIWSILSSKKQ
jgi:regulatory protein